MRSTWKTGLGVSVKSIALLLVGVLAVAAAYVIVVRPMESQLGTDRERVRAAEAQADATAARLSRIEQAGPQAIADLEGRLLQSQVLLPATLDPVALVNVLAPAARNYQVDLQLSYDGASVVPTPGQAYSVTLQGTATGSQQAITSWLISLQQSRPLITVSAFSVSSLDGQAVANVALTVWGYGENAPAVVPSPTPTAPGPQPAPTVAPTVAPTAPVPAPTAPVPAPTAPVPAPTAPVPAPTAPVPAPTGPAPAPTGAPVPVITPSAPGS